jgi:hypothetical protein
MLASSASLPTKCRGGAGGRNRGGTSFLPRMFPVALTASTSLINPYLPELLKLRAFLVLHQTAIE